MKSFMSLLCILLFTLAASKAQNIRSVSGTTLPANCTPGDEFTKSNATVGQKKYICVVTDTWEQQGGVGSARTINTTTPLTGGGDLSTDRNLSCPTCEVTGSKNATNGYAGLDASSKLSASQLPSPSATTLGGVESLAATSHQWINAISTSGVPSSTQPAAGDISGLASSATSDTTNAANITSGTLPAARLPNPSASTLGGVESKDCSSTGAGGVGKINTDGTVSCSSVVRSFGVTIDGGGSAITTGTAHYAQIHTPTSAGCTITNWTVLADQSGTVTVDIKRATYATFPTTASIVGAGNKPTLSSAQKNTATVSGWTSTAIADKDTIEFNVDSASTATWVLVSVRMTCL